jgi:hypothetical protein
MLTVVQQFTGKPCQQTIRIGDGASYRNPRAAAGSLTTTWMPGD